ILAVDGIPMETMDIQRIGEAKNVTVLRNGTELILDMPAGLMQQIIAENTWFAKERIPFVIGGILEDSPAEKAGLMVNDSVIAIAGEAIPSYSEATSVLNKHKNESVDFVFYRNGSLQTLPVIISEEGKIGVGMQSIAQLYELVNKRYTLIEAIPAGISKGVDRLGGYVGSLKYVFTKEGAQSVGGFVAIGNIFPSVWNWRSFWELTAFLSIMLGFMNILPIPALDGGHVLFLLYEVVTRRKPNEKFMEYAQLAGMALLFGLLIFANGNDLFKLFFK
ncbi:MAG: M50 family metallopeptidase, partial [Bacteroidales bacterium]